jgi:hypothetical protein
MTELQVKIRQFVVEAIQERLRKELPPRPADLEELSTRVAEGLIYLSFLPQVFDCHQQEIGEGGENESDYRRLVEMVASEVYVAVLEYFNGSEKAAPNYPLNAVHFQYH